MSEITGRKTVQAIRLRLARKSAVLTAQIILLQGAMTDQVIPLLPATIQDRAHLRAAVNHPAAVHRAVNAATHPARLHPGEEDNLIQW